MNSLNPAVRAFLESSYTGAKDHEKTRKPAKYAQQACRDDLHASTFAAKGRSLCRETVVEKVEDFFFDSPLDGVQVPVRLYDPRRYVTGSVRALTARSVSSVDS